MERSVSNCCKEGHQAGPYGDIRLKWGGVVDELTCDLNISITDILNFAKKNGYSEDKEKVAIAEHVFAIISLAFNDIARFDKDSIFIRREHYRNNYKLIAISGYLLHVHDKIIEIFRNNPAIISDLKLEKVAESYINKVRHKDFY